MYMSTSLPSIGFSRSCLHICITSKLLWRMTNGKLHAQVKLSKLRFHWKYVAALWAIRLLGSQLRVLHCALSAPPTKTHRGTGSSRGTTVPRLPIKVNPTECGMHSSIGPFLRSRKRTFILAPRAQTDARRPCAQPRTQFGNPSISIRSQ